ncbi:hypothetical protein [uncultured Martelella sp.]|uniref:hypothetical protein n=1 Tax=uncultured Martelella sp. TaxID=392331 RepID=UPI0029C69F33|nr:hypothetical protein [uncultured Martelella sp.]
MSHLRGHAIELRQGVWTFCDTGEPTAGTWRKRPCGHCGRHNTVEGHDACLGTLPGVANACCGHGRRREAYAQFSRLTLRGRAACAFFALATRPGFLTGLLLYIAILATTAFFWLRLEAWLGGPHG